MYMTPIRQIHHLEILPSLGTVIGVPFAPLSPVFPLLWGFFLWMRLNWYGGAPELHILCACLKHGNLISVYCGTFTPHLVSPVSL